MDYRIELLNEKKLVGKSLTMTFANNKTVELWRSFMPRRNEIKNKVSNDLISLQIYDESFDFNKFDVNIEFKKWAAVEVTDFDLIPEGMESLVLPEGKYAVFIHRGSNSDDSTFRYIFKSWLPDSEFVLDNRPHLEILGEKYKNGDANSEEEIWIPIKNK